MEFDCDCGDDVDGFEEPELRDVDRTLLHRVWEPLMQNLRAPSAGVQVLTENSSEDPGPIVGVSLCHAHGGGFVVLLLTELTFLRERVEEVVLVVDAFVEGDPFRPAPSEAPSHRSAPQIADVRQHAGVDADSRVRRSEC